MIYLQRNNSEDIYQFDTNTCELKKTKQYSRKINGFISFEKCGLIKHKSAAVPLSIFCIKDKVYLCIGKNRYAANDIDINEFSLFIRIVNILYKGEVVFHCKQWTRDIDEFYMNDFFYFLKYSQKQNFENILALCDGVQRINRNLKNHDR